MSRKTVSLTGPIAFVMSPRLGDSLLSMVIVNNLVRAGYPVTVFGDYLHSLRDWFADFDIRPTLVDDDAGAALAGYAMLIHAYPVDIAPGVSPTDPRVLVLDRWPGYRQVKNMVDIQADACRALFGLDDVVRENGLSVPADLVFRGQRARVALHPTANLVQKQWLPERFAALAERLRDNGLEPSFILAPAEREAWAWLMERGFDMPVLPSLQAVARWIHESGWFIGNDSGLAHLASNLGVPAISLVVRRKIARRWGPGWAPARAVLPLPVLPGKMAKDALWKYCLPVSRVLNAFTDLRTECAGAPPARVGPSGR